MRWLDGITNSLDVNLGKFPEMVRNREARHAAVLGVKKSQTRLSDFTFTFGKIKKVMSGGHLELIDAMNILASIISTSLEKILMLGKIESRRRG